MRYQQFFPLSAILFVSLGSAEDSTFLKRILSEIREKPIDISTETAHYKPLFGLGDDRSAIVRGIARYGELTLDPAGTSQIVNSPDEEQVYFILGNRSLF